MKVKMPEKWRVTENWNVSRKSWSIIDYSVFAG